MNKELGTATVLKDPKLERAFYEMVSELFEQSVILDISGFGSIYQQTQTAFGLREQHQK